MKMSFILILFTLLSCGSGDDNDEAEFEESRLDKTIFSQWERRDHLASFDLSRGAFNVPSYSSFSTLSGETCSCMTLIRGNELSGELHVYNCTGTAGCDVTWENGRRPYRYSKAGRLLDLCEAPGRCDNFH